MAYGACNCGQVSFEIKADVSDIYVCHCSICRRYTGASGIAVIVVANEAFRWLSGEESIASWKKPDGDWHAFFCRTCGSALPGPNDERRMFVPAGLISGDEGQLKVAHHIWVESRADWDEIGDDGHQHPEGIEG